jgi:lactate permease
LPIFTLLWLLGILRKPAWIAGLAGLGVTGALAIFGYGMPASIAASAALYGAAFGLFPICWIIYSAIVLYRVSVETGKFEVIKDSIGSLTSDSRLQALLIAFAFGAFIEGAAGFGTPVAVAAAMLTGLGFTPFYAAAICLLANTAPVAFGSIGIPVVTLAGVTGLSMQALSADVGRLCAPVSLFIPSYMILAMSGRRAFRDVWPAAALCGVAFASVQFAISNFVGPQLTDILASLSAMGSLVILLKVWTPATSSPEVLAMAAGYSASSSGTASYRAAAPVSTKHHSTNELLWAWLPYILLVIFVLLWGYHPIGAQLNRVSIAIPWPGVHNLVQRVPPAVAAVSPYPAIFNFNWLAAAGTSCMLAALISAVLLGMKVGQILKLLMAVLRQLAFPILTVASVLALAFLMNYSGATVTLGLAFAATGAAFPFFSSLLGWVGVFLTGSDTSANALFGSLQVVTAKSLGLNPVLMASANSAGGVMGKMISLSSIAVAAAATDMAREDEGKLFRFTFKHSIFLASVIGLLALLYAYV